MTGTIDYRAIFNAVPGLYWVVEPGSYRIVAVSDEFLRATRNHRDDLIGKPIFDVFPGNPDDPDGGEGVCSLRASLERVRLRGKPDEMVVQRYAIPASAKDRRFEEHYWSAVNAPVFDVDGRLLYIAHRTEDITDLIRLKQRENETREGQLHFRSRAEKMEADITLRSQELKRVNDHLRFAQEVTHIGSWEYWIADGRRIWSDEVYRILGLDPREKQPHENVIRSVVHPEDRKLLEEARRRALQGEEEPEFEHRIIRPDGEIRYVRERAELITDDDRNPVRLFGTIQDITEERKTQDELRRNEHLLGIAGKMAKLGAWELDVAKQRVTWSEEVCAIHELEPCSSIGLEEAFDFIAPEWREKVKDAIGACIRDAIPYDEEFVIITARGNRSWVRAVGRPVHGENGAVICIQGALQDITQRKQAEADVKALENRLAETLENISDAFATLDDEWRVTYMNKEAEHVMRKSRDELLGKVIWDEYPDAVGGRFDQEYRRAMNEQRTVRFEDYYAPLDVWLDVTVYPSGKGIAVYFRDVTERKLAQEAARESEERTNLIIETALDAVISIDSESVITGWNSQAENIFGWSSKEALGEHIYDLIIPEEYREAHRRGLAHFLDTGEGALLNRRVEVSALRKNGHEFPAELAISPIRSGNSFTFSAFLRDITERKEAENAVRESEARFRMVAKATADTIRDWEFATNRVWWNEGLQKVFGFRAEEIGSDLRSWTSRIHPDDLARVMDGVQHVIEDGKDEWKDEYRFRRKNGSYAHVVDRGFVVRDHLGEATRMISGFNDITKRKEYETRMREQAALLDKAQDAIIVRDINNFITYWNKGAERLYGWTADEAVGRHMEALLRPPADQFREANRKVIAEGEWNGEIVKKRKDGKAIFVEGAWTLVRDEHDKPESVLTIDTNITERVALEEQLRQSQRLESIGQLTGGVAHDFNNLLTVILGNAELMADQLPANTRLRKLAEMSRTAAQRGSELTHRLLAFARRQTLEPRIIDTNTLVLGMEDLWRRTLPENIDIEIIPADNAWRAFVDPGQLESVLLNLAINAKDAMPDGGLLTIETDNVQLDSEYAANNAEVKAGRYVMIAVSDTGCGIPPENINRVFDPFFTTKEKGKGTGLGLSMAYGFVKQSEGHIKVYSEPGRGTTVKLYLPMANRPEDVPKPVPVDERDLSGTETILVVEDDDLVRAHAEGQLEGFGYQVIAARNGPEAMEILKNKTEDIDLLFTDVIMSGGMNGRELAEVARRLRPRLKVLYTSGYTENAIVHHGQLDPGVSLLQKPYQRADLAKKIRGALNETSTGGQDGNSS